MNKIIVAFLFLAVVLPTITRPARPERPVKPVIEIVKPEKPVV